MVHMAINIATRDKESTERLLCGPLTIIHELDPLKSKKVRLVRISVWKVNIPLLAHFRRELPVAAEAMLARGALVLSTVLL